MSVSFKRGWVVRSDHLGRLKPMGKLLSREASRGQEGKRDLLRHDDRCPGRFHGRGEESR